MILCLSVLELSSRNHLVDRQTDGPTCAKQYTPSSSKGDINITSGSFSDICLVVHWGAPRSHLSYWQEVGREGRDRNLSLAVVYPYGRSLVGDSGMREKFKSVESLRMFV
ncbi:hypothetical protein DPMN_169036 [Dreissena polymorpha]|uniref:Helicase C-terminal domain-containing protein n=1 Tax=Dreissena polymorpha TaxID=45954 RepID=A0A9D4F4I3_DREPO|nr:hypothetical protein DPMN_169036 [Dreissena polymorpha]